jgi:putative restriction endonuclease
MMPTLDKQLSLYIRQFAKLRTDRSANWTLATQKQAPHKPFLLLSILDLLAEGYILSNLIEITPELGEHFAEYWDLILPEHRGNLALPFFHMRSSKFWHLVPKPGQEAVLAAANRGYSIGQLQRMLLGAKLDEELFALLQIEEARDALRATLIQTYFAPEYHGILFEQGQLNLQAYLYSQQLLEQAGTVVKEEPDREDTYKHNVRDQGFRKAVVRIYEHRCAFCGVRMLTSTGHTVVDAAHIIPWSISQNDDIHNGMALCRLCHWTFDEGLAGVSTKYQVMLSKELQMMENRPGHLLTVENRPILGPKEEDLWPDLDALNWHRQNVFMKG